VQERGATPEAEARLRATIVTLKNTIASKNKELDQLRADVPALVRAINQLTLENRQLREQLANPGPDMIPLRSRNSPNPTAGRITGLRERRDDFTARDQPGGNHDQRSPIAPSRLQIAQADR
jgi:regulator of replication initiation timing